MPKAIELRASQVEVPAIHLGRTLPFPTISIPTLAAFTLPLLAGREAFFLSLNRQVGEPEGTPGAQNRDFSIWRRHRAPRFGFARDLTLSRFPQNIGFAGEHRGPRQRGCLRITFHHAAD
jgi:hypothetical protein